MPVSTTPRSAGPATEPDAGPVTPALTCDVLVVGAGPAGTAAAIELRRGGSHVVVVDKAVFPRDKCCGDGLTTLALRELEHLGLDPSTVTGWHDVSAAWLRSPSGREVELPLPTEGKFAAVAPRRELDDALVRLARAAGVDVRDGCAFAGMSPATNTTTGPTTDATTGRAIDVENRDVIDLSIDGIGTVRAHYVIAADGMWSPVRKALGVNQPGYLGEWHAFRQYVSDVTGPAADRLYVWFEADLLPGYAWSFPLPGNRANVGFGVLRERSRRVGEMKDLWVDLLQRPHIVAALGAGFELEDRHTAWPIPARIDDITLSHGRTMFVGDAAAATDVMTGEGIGQALLTGRLAAEAILATGTGDPAKARAAYESAVRHHLFADHTMSRLLGRVLRHPLGARGAIRVVATSGVWGRRNFARWMFEDEPRAVILTPRRWHRAVPRPAGRLPQLSGAPAPARVSAGAVPSELAADPCARVVERSRRRRRPSCRPRRDRGCAARPTPRPRSGSPPWSGPRRCRAAPTSRPPSPPRDAALAAPGRDRAQSRFGDAPLAVGVVVAELGHRSVGDR